MSSDSEPFDLDDLLALWRAPAPRAAEEPPARPLEPLAAPSERPAVRAELLVMETEPLGIPIAPAIEERASEPQIATRVAAPLDADPMALLDDLMRALASTFGEQSQEFAIASRLVESANPETMPTRSLDAMKVGEVFRAIVGMEGEPAAAEALTAYRARLAKALDALEDTLDGLVLAVEARA